MTTNNGDTYLTPEEAASKLHRSRRTIDRYAAQGHLKRYRRGLMRQVVYKLSDVENLEAQLNRVTPDEPEN